MYLIAQLFLLDNITIHLGFFIRAEEFFILGEALEKKKKQTLIISDLRSMWIAQLCPILSAQSKTSFSHGFHCKFMPPLRQWSVTGVGGLCLEKQTIDLSESRCVCDFISEAVRERRQTVKVKAKWFRTLRQVCFALPLPLSLSWMYIIQDVYPKMSLKQKNPSIFETHLFFSVLRSYFFIYYLLITYYST